MTLCIQVIIPFNDPPNPYLTEAKQELEDRKGGFPHSEISGSKGARASPELIAACHVLLRLPTPRHPSEALMRLIVLSKTHAQRRSRHPARDRGSHSTRHTDFAVRQCLLKIGPKSTRGCRTNPSFTMSTQGHSPTGIRSLMRSLSHRR